MTAVQGTSAAVETKFLSKPIVAEPGTACTETYLVAGHFDSEKEATNYAQYLRTRFVRFLVSLRKATQHATRDVYSFVPDLPLNQEWTDAKLYKRYGLIENEIAFIESQVAEHDGELFEEAGQAEAEDD
jgi:site-specific DNA-methyltransferase (adenine-specific)